MKCPHCAIAFHENWSTTVLQYHRSQTIWNTQMAWCPACEEFTIVLYDDHNKYRHTVHPLHAVRPPLPNEVPRGIAQDYLEAASVLSLSPKASAALSRRCLQNVLHGNGYKARDLAREIEMVLADPKIPDHIGRTVDAIRGFGNFSAHPITDQTALQIIDVEPHEAEFCLDILDALFDHFYVKPAKAKAMKDALDAKLAKAGKPASK